MGYDSNTILYYGNGECSLETTQEISVIHIKYNGAGVRIESKVDSNYIFINKLNAITIAAFQPGSINEIFIYSGNINILDVKIFNINKEPIYCKIKKRLDYTELLDVNTEAMDRMANEIGINISHNNKKIKVSNVIENRNTKDDNEILITETGEDYNGDYHIHIHTQKIVFQLMSGANHNKNSVNLYRIESDKFKKKKALKKQLKNRERLIKGKGKIYE